MTGSGDLLKFDAKLADLADNGGSTLTHALLYGSPAIDQGDPAGCRDFQGTLLSRDQRLAPRVVRCDIGAFERGGVVPVGEPIFFADFEDGDVSEWSVAAQ